MSARDIAEIEEGVPDPSDNRTVNDGTTFCTSANVVVVTQKIVAEAIGTYFLIFVGCGVCVAWGLIFMVMVYSVGHISGAHFNPAVTIAFAIFRQFSYKQVPLYILAQLLGSILASVGSNIQSLVTEFITSFLLMFVISGVATDNRSIGELAGIAIGMTILIDVLIAGPISGGSMNPARSIGPALIMHQFKSL
ncbi:probable aquaporin NIP-type [Olea europaea subsp. europaea]|uniref:Probable aquaporin NIP-type n=1 Tax=Olea europaea subsp. europaea TaxID=158383 RepID=A0A8S0QVP0_OLEEU|nr:probable aquaporin NIP-type [Olea europaea subsp. europaea]